MVDRISGPSQTSFPSFYEEIDLRTPPVPQRDTLEVSANQDCFCQIWDFVVRFFSCLFCCCEDIPDLDTLENKIAGEILSLTEEVKELRKKLNKLDGFILENPELKKVVSETLPAYLAQGFAANCTRPSTDHLDPNKPVDRSALLKYEKIILSHELEERMVFIRSNPAVYECFVQQTTLRKS